jgi:thiosulfate/3-mercaptopyruvate sulfurtransferase
MKDTALLIDCDGLLRRIAEPGLQIVDCRFELLDPEAGRRQYLRGHIPGAVYADLDVDLAGPIGPGSGRHPLPDPQTMATTLGRLGIDTGTEVVVYDQGSGAVASRLWWLLRWLGHENVRLLDGGYARWQGLGYAIEEGEVTAPTAEFVGAPRPELVLETDEILAALDRCEALQLIDARDSERFAGAHEPIDPVAGHIPGAINLPLSASLHADGTWKSPDELEELWAETLGCGSGAPWSVMCGSGVTACHLAVSGLLAGLPEPRLYVGSWSEWIADPKRPVAVTTT